jgi:hypothetical protein
VNARAKYDPGTVPTLRDLHRAAAWIWLDCTACQHRRPVLIVHLMIALGVDASSDRVRAGAICPKCCHKGAMTYVPSHVDSVTGSAPFPGYD